MNWMLEQGISKEALSHSDYGGPDKIIPTLTEFPHIEVFSFEDDSYEVIYWTDRKMEDGKYLPTFFDPYSINFLNDLKAMMIADGLINANI